MLLLFLWGGPVPAAELLLEYGLAAEEADAYGDRPDIGAVSLRGGRSAFVEMMAGKWRGEEPKFAALSVGLRTSGRLFFEASAGIASYEDDYEGFGDATHSTHALAIGYEKNNSSLRFGYRYFADGAYYTSPTGAAVMEYDLDGGGATAVQEGGRRNTGERVYVLGVGFRF